MANHHWTAAPTDDPEGGPTDLAEISSDDHAWMQFVRKAPEYVLPQSLVIIEPMSKANVPDTIAVYRACIQSNMVAVKCLAMMSVPQRTRALGEWQRWRALKHDNIVPLAGVTIIDQRLALISPLRTTLHLNEPWICRELDVIRLMIGVAKALEYLHGRRMIHGSVTLDHIVVHNGDAQVLDFGSCTDGEFGSERSGSTGYEAPEMSCPQLRGPFGYTCRVDIYSIGVVTAVLLGGSVDGEGDARRITLPNTVSTATRQVIDKCLQREAKRRPSAATLLDNLQNCCQVADRPVQTNRDLVNVPRQMIKSDVAPPGSHWPPRREVRMHDDNERLVLEQVMNPLAESWYPTQSQGAAPVLNDGKLPSRKVHSAPPAPGELFDIVKHLLDDDPTSPPRTESGETVLGEQDTHSSNPGSSGVAAKSNSIGKITLAATRSTLWAVANLVWKAGKAVGTIASSTSSGQGSL
ncbi:Protein kinase domain-containing protein [Plasmodiophora brassicae]